MLSFITSLSNSQALDSAQVYTTSNLVNSGTTSTNTTSEWQNVGLWNQGLPCWAPGGPVYCGPNPYFNNGSFNFSYGTADVYQNLNIAAALPNSGTGLRVNGFNFGFSAKNGNGWDDGRLDYLVAYVNFYGADGKLAQAYNYGAATNQQYNWTTFNFIETFATPYATKDLSTARYGFVGRDNNFWAGPYGPEVTNISFSLKYSVDPCSVDVLSSPTCPGYLDAINRLSAPPMVASTSNTSTTPTTTGSTTSASTTSPTSTSTFDVAQPTSTTSSTTTAPTPTAATTATSATPTATNPQPKVGEVTVASTPAKTTMSTSQLLAIVRNEQSRIGSLETSTAQQAVEQAQAAGDRAQKDSLAISMATMGQSQASAQTIATMFATNPSQISSTSSSSTINNSNSSSVANLTPVPGKTTVVDILKAPEINIGTVTQTSVVTKPMEFKTPEPLQVTVESPPPATTKPQNIYSLTAPTYVPQPSVSVAMLAPQTNYSLPKSTVSKSEAEEQPKAEGIKFTGNNPIANIINTVPVLPTQSADTQTQSTAVNTKVQDNDIATGGVSLTAMARQPTGFESYMSTLPDAAFYAPKEIYRNQRVVDNARAQRLLQGASDRLHQELINSQYK